VASSRDETREHLGNWRKSIENVPSLDT